MKRTHLLVAAALCVAVAASLVTWRQHSELQELRRQRETFEDFCRGERVYARALAQMLENTKGNVGTATILDYYGPQNALRACLPGIEFDFRAAESCWIAKGESSCLLPLANAIATAFERHWPLK